jgi:LmbE family N-acetylglucosaminyl deacetylase
LRHDCALRLLAQGPRTAALLVAAHPDDESVGAGSALGDLLHGGWRVEILHVTDGVPRDPRLRPSLREGSRRENARIRADEVVAALRVGGIEAPATMVLPCLGVLDQEAATTMPWIARRIASVVVMRGSRVMITHPYEGGHPDHDAVAFAVHAAAALLRSRGHEIALAEMTSYHRASGGLVTAAFREGGLAAPCRRSRPGVLDGSARRRKRQMLDAFVSQADVLASFRVDLEPMRCAPRYDFSRPPHAGTLNYELWPFGWTGARFCELARSAMRDLGLEPPNRRALAGRSSAPKRYL